MPAGRILVVDDEMNVRRVVADMLRLAGYEVTEADSGEEALAAAQTTPPDLLLSDLRLQGIQGFELLQALRESRPGLRAIAMTGFADETCRRAALDAGYHHVICKPFSIRDLMAAVDRLFPGRPSG